MARARGAIVGVVAMLLLGDACGGAQHGGAGEVVDVATRVRIAQAEARRGGGVDELVQLAATGDRSTRVLALRGLGRIGGAHAAEALLVALADRDPVIASAAGGALGLAAALEVLPSAQEAQATRALVELLARTGVDRAEIAEALGRAGDASAQAPLADLLTAEPELATTAANALGRFGRRKLALEAAARVAVRAAMASRDPRVRAAATWALAREQVAADPNAAPDPAIAAFVAHISDDDPPTRAAAIAGVAKHGAVASARDAIVAALHDPDWRVAVEAVRALAGEHGDERGRDAVAAALHAQLDALAGGNLPSEHVVLEALRALAPAAATPAVGTAIDDALAPRPRIAPLTHAWIVCLAQQLRTRAHGKAAPLDAVAQCSPDLPDPLRLPLVAELATDGFGGADAHRVLTELLAHADPRVRAAGLGAAVGQWSALTAEDRADLLARVVTALRDENPVIAGAAADAADTLETALAGAKPATDAEAVGQLATLDAVVFDRAAHEPEPELAASLLEVIGKHKLAAGADACRAGLEGHVVTARAAAVCLHALDSTTPAPTALADPPYASLPPELDVASVIGKSVRWHLDTTRGAIELELRPDVAPWAVATIVALTRRHFYDGLEFHRVVPGFVVQGGDPTMSGAGGPGFTIPAEPATHADGAGFATGGLGIADAGPDSGGSQWFIMHAGAPHLDGRYTWLGAVTAGQAVADALVVGDAVTRATVTVDAR